MPDCVVIDVTPALPVADPAVNERAKVAQEFTEHGKFLRDKGHFLAALTAFKRASALAPYEPGVWCNIGAIYWNLGEYRLGVENCLKALALEPNHVMATANLAVIFTSMGQVDRGDSYHRRAIELEPPNLELKLRRAYSLLSRGQWGEGFENYEYRVENPANYVEMPAPFWEGQNLDGRKIYLQMEQGLGDRLLFSRFIYWLTMTYPKAEVVMGVDNQWFNLLWEFRNVMTLLPEGTPWPTDLDYSLYVGSLPKFAFAHSDLVTPDPGLIKRRVEQQHKLSPFNLPEPHYRSLKVGVCWTGNPAQNRNLDRAIPLELLLPLAEDPRVVLYSLQLGPGRNDLARLGMDQLICDVGDDLEAHKLVGLGNAMLGLDLVITVCTSVAHMAGVLNVPCWTLLCSDPYWLWGRSGERTPWYSEMRLYRQTSPKDWVGVVDRVQADLTDLTNRIVGFN